MTYQPPGAIGRANEVMTKMELHISYRYDSLWFFQGPHETTGSPKWLSGFQAHILPVNYWGFTTKRNENKPSRSYNKILATHELWVFVWCLETTQIF